MYNLKAIAAFLPSSLNATLTVAHTATALKQWLHGDTAPVVDTLQALTDKPYAKRKPEQTPEQYRIDLISALKSATGKDAIKARLHALGETLEATNNTVDLLDLSGNVPALIKMYLEESKATRATLKAAKTPSEVTTVAPTATQATQPAKVETLTITAQSVIDAINSKQFNANDIEAIQQALSALTVIV